MSKEEKRAMKVMGGLLVIIFVLIPIMVIGSFIVNQFGF